MAQRGGWKEKAGQTMGFPGVDARANAPARPFWSGRGLSEVVPGPDFCKSLLEAASSRKPVLQKPGGRKRRTPVSWENPEARRGRTAYCAPRRLSMWADGSGPGRGEWRWDSQRDQRPGEDGPSQETGGRTESGESWRSGSAPGDRGPGEHPGWSRGSGHRRGLEASRGLPSFSKWYCNTIPGCPPEGQSRETAFRADGLAFRINRKSEVRRGRWEG